MLYDRDKERVFLLALQPSAEQVTKKSPLSHQGVRMASPTPTLLFSASVPLQVPPSLPVESGCTNA